MKTLRGVIHGKAIELTEDSGLPEGQEVKVTVEPLAREESAPSGALEALKRAAGGWCDDPEGLEQYLEWNRRRRKIQPREIAE